MARPFGRTAVGRQQHLQGPLSDRRGSRLGVQRFRNCEAAHSGETVVWTVVWTCAPSFLSLVTILKKAMLRLPQKKTVYEVLPSVEHARRHAQRTTYARRAVGDRQQRGSDAGQLVLLGVRPADQQQWIPLCNRRGRGAVRLTVLDGGNGASLLAKRGVAARRQLLLDVRQRCIAARALVMKIRVGCARRLRAGMCFSSAAAPPRAAAGLTRREAPGCSQSAAPARSCDVDERECAARRRLLLYALPQG